MRKIGLTPTPKFGVGVEKADFLWENEKKLDTKNSGSTNKNW
jgi:hypothetical protein